MNLHSGAMKNPWIYKLFTCYQMGSLVNITRVRYITVFVKITIFTLVGEYIQGFLNLFGFSWIFS